jgi:YHS domain-containing protein
MKAITCLLITALVAVCLIQLASAALPVKHLNKKGVKIGDKTICPVSGKVITVAVDTPKEIYDGVTYYFCCAHCVEKFLKNPDLFVDPLKSHPEVLLMREDVLNN